MTGTIVLDESCDAENDSRDLKKAMKGIGTDEAAIIKILSNRTVEQRLDICVKFKVTFSILIHIIILLLPFHYII